MKPYFTIIISRVLMGTVPILINECKYRKKPTRAGIANSYLANRGNLKWLSLD